MFSNFSEVNSLFKIPDEIFQNFSNLQDLKISIIQSENSELIYQFGNIKLNESQADSLIEKLIYHYKDHTKALKVFQNKFQNCLENTHKDFSNIKIKENLTHNIHLLNLLILTSEIKDKINQFNTYDNPDKLIEDVNKLEKIKREIILIENSCCSEVTLNSNQINIILKNLQNLYLETCKTIYFFAPVEEKIALIREILTHSHEIELKDWMDNPFLKKDQYGLNDLHYAAWVGEKKDFDLIKDKLGNELQNYINESSTTEHHLETPLHIAIHTTLHTNNYSKIEWLINHGADINKRNQYGETPLMLAISQNDLNMVDFLIKNKNIDIHTRDIYGRNLFHVAADLEDKSILQFLQSIDKFKELEETVDIFGQSPLDLAIENRRDETICHLLKNKDLNPSILPNYGKKKIDISQEHILSQWQKYLDVVNPVSTILHDSAGMCFGFGFMLQYLTDLGQGDEFFQTLELFSSWDGSLDSLENKECIENLSGNYKNLKELFNQWINNVSWLNHIYYSSITDMKQDRLETIYNIVRPPDSKDLSMKLIFGAHSHEVLMNEEQLIEMLHFFSIYPNTSVSIAGNSHATSLRVLDDGSFQYYDANLPHKVKVIKSPNELSKVIFDTKYLQLGSSDKEKMKLCFFWYEFSKGKERNFSIDNSIYEDASANGFTSLHKAIILRDREKVNFLLNNLKEINTEDFHQKSALDWATLMHQNEIVLDLLSHPNLILDFKNQADNAINHKNLQALRLMINYAKEKGMENLDINLNHLLNKYLRLECLEEKNVNSILSEIIELLIIEGADIYKSYIPPTFLFISRLKDEILLKRILACIPDIHRKNEENKNLYDYAVENKNVFLIELLS